jgi:hypothetical protein
LQPRIRSWLVGSQEKVEKVDALFPRNFAIAPDGKQSDAQNKAESVKITEGHVNTQS